jgi:hypothetical protein
MNEQSRIERRSDGGVNASRQEWSRGSRREQFRGKSRQEAEEEVAKYPALTDQEKIVLFAKMTTGTRSHHKLADELGLSVVTVKGHLCEARRKIKAQREAEAGKGGDDTPVWAHDDAAVLSQSWKPAPSTPYNALAGGRPGGTVHIADRVNAEVFSQDEIARVIYENEARRVAEGKPRIWWAPPRVGRFNENMTPAEKSDTMSVRSLSLDEILVRRADGSTETAPRYGPVPTGLAYSPR